MGLVVYWYDFVCFGIVGVAFIGSLYVLCKKEGGARKCDIERSVYESLLVGRPAESNQQRPRGHVSSSQLWTSCWRGLHPLWLLGIRFLSCAVLSGFLAWDILTYDATIFVYYTEWTFALVIIYFAIGTVVSAHGCMVYYSDKPPSDNGERGEFLKRDVEESISTNPATFWGKKIRASVKLQSHYDQEEELQQRAGFWGYLMQTAFQTCAGAVILTDIVFWCIIVPFLTNAHLQLNTLMGCMHTLNAVFLLLDTSVNTLAFPWFRLAYFVLWSCCYVIFQWIIHACGFSWWPYPFLELSSSWAPVWYLCLAVVHIPCYGLYSLLAFPWFRLAYFVLWSCCYVIFQWIIHACGFSWWPYPFLELSSSWAPVWYLCLAVVHIPCYGLYSLLVRAKNSIFSRLFPHAFVASY